MNKILSLLRLLLIVALMGHQPAMATHGMYHVGHGMPAIAALLDGAPHGAPHAADAHAHGPTQTCLSTDAHSAACGACCAVSVVSGVAAGPVVSGSLRLEPVQQSFMPPDLAAALDPPRA